jgi:hypothetical protein
MARAMGPGKAPPSAAPPATFRKPLRLLDRDAMRSDIPKSDDSYDARR